MSCTFSANICCRARDVSTARRRRMHKVGCALPSDSIETAGGPSGFVVFVELPLRGSRAGRLRYMLTKELKLHPESAYTARCVADGWHVQQRRNA